MGENTATDTNTMSAAIRTPRSVRAPCSSRDSTGPLITPIPAGAKTRRPRPARDRAPAAVRRIAGGADEELVAVGARIAGGALGGAGRPRRLARGAGRDARMVAMAAAHRVAAGVVPRGARALRGGAGAAGDRAGRPDAQALVLARAIHAAVGTAPVPVVAVLVGLARGRGQGRRRGRLHGDAAT